MFCYNCGCHLSEHDFCTACGVDVSIYKRIMCVSNMFYNEGLAKAGVRDLSGAINSLRQSLKFNKNHIEARNLLGLVYFEMGEVVAALSEWVISKNLRPDKNIADDYINMIQSNSSRLMSINQTIKKYNQALLYCNQDSKDLAVIQLKKVLSLNPKFVRAHQLLALLYMESEEWEKAERELGKCKKIDCNNTQTLCYMKEVQHMLMPDEVDRQLGKHKKDETIRYEKDNEVIIQPVSVREKKGSAASTLLNIGIGLVIGIATMYFLAVPNAKSDAQNDAQKKITEIGNQLDVKTAKIQELETQIAMLSEQNEGLNREIEGYIGTDGTLSHIDGLLEASATYIASGDLPQTANKLEGIALNMNIEESSEAFRELYTTLLNAIGPELATTYYTEGTEAYRNGEYATAIEKFTKAFYYDAKRGDALYALGNAYRKAEDNQEAVETYDKVMELFPDTDLYRKAKRDKSALVGEDN